MHSLAEITTWTYEDAEVALQVILPAEWSFNYERPELVFEGVIRDDNGDLQWRGLSSDLRLLLLDAYVWCALRGQPVNTTGVWAVRKQELTTQMVQKLALEIPDPGDLVPEEIEALYHLKQEEDENDS